MKINLNFADRLFGKWTKIICFCLSAVLPILLAHQARAAENAVVSRGLSIAAILSVVIGVIISVFYIRGMYLVLHYASETYDIEFDPSRESQFGESAASKILVFGSFMLVVLSALIISSYGWGWLFLYTGPVLCLLGPLVIIVSMEQDLKKYKRALRERALRDPTLDDRVFTR
jgi:MFS family permease